MIDASAFMLPDTKSVPKKVDNSRVTEKSTSNSSENFSNYMDQSTNKSEARVEQRVDDQQRSQAKVEKSEPESVENQDSKDVNKEKVEARVSADQDNSEDVDTDSQVPENTQAVAAPVDEEQTEQSTAALVSLLLQRAIKSNIEDPLDKNKSSETALSAIQKQTSILENLIQKNTTADPLNKDVLQMYKSDMQTEKLSPELMKLMLSGEKEGGSLDNKLQTLNNRQEVLAQMQLKSIDEVMNIDDASSDLIARLVEKLDLDKNKGEALFQNRMTVDKALVASEFTETNLTRVTTESADRNLLLNSVNSTERANNSNSPLQQMKMTTPVSNPEWGAEFGKRIQMLMKNNIQHAEIRMDPPEMGRIHIRINMSQDQANISFTALHANVREAIENNMSRLRDMLGETGLQLGEADVSSQFQQQTNQSRDGQDQFSFQRQQALSGDGHEVSDLPPTVIQREIDGVIDYFA